MMLHHKIVCYVTDDIIIYVYVSMYVYVCIHVCIYVWVLGTVEFFPAVKTLYFDLFSTDM